MAIASRKAGPKKAAKRASAAKGSGVGKLHVVAAGDPVHYETSGHPPRTDSPTYVKSRAALKKIVGSVKGWYFAHGDEPYQDHHGGGLWLHDDDGWFFVRNLVGIEWSGQFCADPAKVDLLRRNAARLFAAFPRSADAYASLGIDLPALLSTEIKTDDDVAEWTDSICNASVPLPQRFHTGTVPKGGGVHNYPTPVTDIDRFKRDDFTLWVLDAEGNTTAVTPVAPIGSDVRRVRVIHSAAGSKLRRSHDAAEKKKGWLVADADHPLTAQAFAKVRPAKAAKAR